MIKLTTHRGPRYFGDVDICSHALMSIDMENPPVVDHFLGTPWVFHIYVSDFQGVSKHFVSLLLPPVDSNRPDFDILEVIPIGKVQRLSPMDESAFFLMLFPGLPRLTLNGFTADDVHRVSKVCRSVARGI